MLTRDETSSDIVDVGNDLIQRCLHFVFKM